MILQEAQRTKLIIQNLLSFARQKPALREPVQINAVLRQTLKLRAYDFSKRDVEVVERFDEDSAGDRRRRASDSASFLEYRE